MAYTSTLFILLCFSYKFVYSFTIPDVRVLIVTGENPDDGHLKFYRSANARNLLPQIIKVEKGSSEVDAIASFLKSISQRDDEILIISSSDKFLAVDESLKIAALLSKIVLKGGGSVAMSYPRKGKEDYINFTTELYEEVQTLREKLRHFSQGTVLQPNVHHLDDWKKSIRLYIQYQNAEVRQKQMQRKMISIDPKFCAFAGLTSAIKELFEKVQTNIPFQNKSLETLCEKASTHASLRHELEIIPDYEGNLFQFIDSNKEEETSLAKGIAGGFVVIDSNNTIPPFVYGSYDEVPFTISNMATDEVFIRETTCNSCPDKKIQDLTKHFGGQENFPEILILVSTSMLLRDIEGFFNNLGNLSYPKDKLSVAFFVNAEAINDYQESYLKKITKNNGKEYMSVENILTDDLAPATNFMKAWEMGKEKKSEYVFMLDPSVRFVSHDVLQILLQSNRRIVGPLLQQINGGYNFKAERKGDTLRDDKKFTLPFKARLSDEFVNCIGLLQVPYVYGAILIQRDVLMRAKKPFQFCYSNCGKKSEKCVKTEEISKSCYMNFYSNITNRDELIWGMMLKNLNEQGFTPYVTNENIFGLIVDNKEL